jgi:hypothetical protein
MFSRSFHLFFASDTSPVVKMITSISCVKQLSNAKKMISDQFGQKSPIGIVLGRPVVWPSGVFAWTAGFPQAAGGIPQPAAILPVAWFGRFTVKHYTMPASVKSKRDCATRHTSCF